MAVINKKDIMNLKNKQGSLYGRVWMKEEYHFDYNFIK